MCHAAAPAAALQYGETPLYTATYNNHIEVVRLLCKAHYHGAGAIASIDTLSSAAVRTAHTLSHVAGELVSAASGSGSAGGGAGAGASASRGHGNSASKGSLFASLGWPTYSTAVSSSASHGGGQLLKVNLADREGETPLHVACGHGHLDVAVLLIEHGADIYAMNDVSLSSLSVASMPLHPSPVPRAD